MNIFMKNTIKRAVIKAALALALFMSCVSFSEASTALIDGDVLFYEQELEALHEAIYFEARGESIAGKIAVAQVIMNRVSSNRFPNTIEEVVHARRKINGRWACAFSYYCDGLPDRYKKSGKLYDEIRYVAEMVISSDIVDITSGATHYYANWIKAPYWVESMRKTTSIDTHIFYKEK